MRSVGCSRKFHFVKIRSSCAFSSAIDLTAIKKLREISGAPMMDCKSALAAADVQGDLEKALAWLRAKGIAKVTSNSRATKEGLIGVFTSEDKKTLALVEVNCETGFFFF
jgi:elongation factor Ts